MYWVNFSIIIFVIIALISSLVYIFRYKWTGEGQLRRFAQNISIALSTILITLILLELFFSVFAQSDSLGYTLAARNWFKRYWVKNSLGYRDVEWTSQMLADRTKIMVLGDSFAAGWGIKNKEDLFSYKLGQLLGDEYAVMNVSRAGANTEAEIKMALKYPHEPDIIILAFYLNDVDGVAVDKGLPPLPAARVEVPALIEPLVANSYAANFLYWRIYRLKPQERRTTYYWTWLQGRYSDPEVWLVFKELLLSIDTYVKEQEKQLIVVVFPNLMAVEDSRPMTSKVVQVYTERGTAVLDVTDLVAGMNSRKLVVNSVDPHPSQFVHQLVAEALYPMVVASEKSMANQQ